LASTKVLTIWSIAGQYNKPVLNGRESAHKSRPQGDPSSLGDYMYAIQNISKEEYETVTVRQFFSLSAYFFPLR
jgi:hypothetical protein